MPLDVSVVVPVFNPGANLESCLASLLAQTLPADRYEVVLVDDGSTDGTARELAEWAAHHPRRIRVLTEPNSGWPGRPRNVGVDAARGDYVQFVDNDDLLAPPALEAMVAAARSCAADVVLGKISSDFRGINHDVYRDDALGVTLATFPLVESLTPHKMFRREFLQHHGLRFAEGPRHLEDQLYCMHAYAHATSVAVVATEQCYFYRRRRGFGRNAGDVPAEPDDYYRDLDDVLDVIAGHVEPRTANRLYERFLRVEMLGRLRDRAMLDYDPAYRRRLFDRVRRSATDRIPAAVDTLLPAVVRRQAALLRGGDLDAMVALAAATDSLRATATVDDLRWADGRLVLDLATALDGDPALFADGGAGSADLVVVGRGDAATWFAGTTVPLTPAADGVSGRASVTFDPRTVLFGRPLPPGLWDLRVRARYGGLTRAPHVAPAEGVELVSCLYDDDPHAVAPYRTATGGLALDVDEWASATTRRVADGAACTGAGRWTVDGVVGSARLNAELFVRSGSAVSAVPATLVATGDGAGLSADAALPPGEVWVRVGEPGRSEPRPLPR